MNTTPTFPNFGIWVGKNSQGLGSLSFLCKYLIARRGTLPYQPLLLRRRELELTRMHQRLSHEKLRVYQLAIEFLALSGKFQQSLPRGNAVLTDQFKRAALSIPLNIAEAAGKASRADSARFFAIARGSALECVAILDACRVLNLVESVDAESAKSLLVAIVSMLSKLCR